MVNCTVLLELIKLIETQFNQLYLQVPLHKMPFQKVSPRLTFSNPMQRGASFHLNKVMNGGVTS